MKFLILILFLLFNLLTNPAKAFFDRDVHFLTMEDGLSNNTVSSIHKDKDGFMWFGTNHGLSRYDGKVIKNFCSSQFYYMNISEIVELSDTYLGVIANNNFFCFDRSSEQFISLTNFFNEHLHISHLLTAGNHSFWVLSDKQLQLYSYENVTYADSVSMHFNVEQSYTELVTSDERLMAMTYSEDKKNLWLVTDSGYLILFDPQFPDNIRRMRLVDEKITPTYVLCDKGVLWVSTILNGIIRYHILTGQIETLTYEGENKSGGLSHTDVFKIIPINENRYLAVTWDGYTLFMPNEDNPWKISTEIYKDIASQLNRNMESRMISVYYDPKGIIWIGTNGGGVMYSDLRLQFYKQYHQKRHNEICGILMDSERRLWLATYHQGIMRSDSPFDPLHKLSFTVVGDREVLQRETVLCVLKDDEGNLWFGNKDGTLTSYNENTKQFKVHLLNLDEGINKSQIWALYIDSHKRFWIGTNDGLLLFDMTLAHGRKVHLKSQHSSAISTFVRAIAGFADGIIGVGTTQGGFYKIVIDDKNHIKSQNGYENNTKIVSRSVRSLLAGSDGNFYIGYIDGFLIFSPQTDKILGHYTTADGLCSNFVGSITEDYKGRIWLGNNSGVSRYSVHQNLFYNYYISGNNRSVLAFDHLLLWGNNKNLTYFDVDELDSDVINDNVLITGLDINMRPVGIGEEINGQIILKKSISYTQSIVLNHENRDLSLTFNNLSYLGSQQKYNYRLFPYQEEWIVSNNGEKASYTNLPAGKYLFEVKNVNSDHVGENVTTLEIVVLPHWSHALWFRSLIILLLGIIAYYLYRKMRLRQKRLEYELKMQHELFVLHTERDKEKQIRIERENFFTNAAHELRTPLTLILSPLQSLLSSMKPSDPAYDSLAVMYRNSKALHTLVDRLLYVQKIEAGMVKLHLSQADIMSIVREQAESFLQTANAHQLEFTINLPDEPMPLWIDIEKITSAIRNLLSNAFKYTHPLGKIWIEADRVEIDKQGYCRITVSDTGEGIPEDLQKSVFESFVTGENRPGFSTKMGVGLCIVKNTMDLHHGLVSLESVQGSGSKFTLLIPEGRGHFANDKYEVIENPSIENAPFVYLPPKAAVVQEVVKNMKRILIIEDNEEVRQYICSLFHNDYNIIQAADGEEGIRAAMEQIPDIIISDVMMPVKDGFACCRELRENFRTAHIPILMLTAKAEDKDILYGSKVGADEYMMKPFNPEILKSKVENLVLQRERLKHIYTKTLMLHSDELSVADKEGTDEFMKQVIYIIETNLSDENFNVKMLADQLNMSQPTLYRKMKQRSELAAIDMIRSVRMSKAASLIMENRYTIQEIAEMVGYSDTRTLRKHFTEQFGVSPSKYMEKE